MLFDKRVAAIAAAALLVLGIVAYLRAGSVAPAVADRPTQQAALNPAADEANLDLTETQMASITVEAVAERSVPQEKEAYGSIDYDEDRAVQIFTPYQGRIIEAIPKLGDEVQKGQVMFTIESPDLIQAESTLIAAAGVLDLTSRALRRARELYAKEALAQKDLEQPVSDQQTAEAALKAARDAVRVFGKTDADMDRMIAQRRVDRELIVPSPISGRVTARNAQPGLFVQPGNPPAPYTVADLSTLWMIANVNELDSSLFHVGQQVAVTILAFPGRIFLGKSRDLPRASIPIFTAWSCAPRSPTRNASCGPACSPTSRSIPAIRSRRWPFRWRALFASRTVLKPCGSPPTSGISRSAVSRSGCKTTAIGRSSTV